MPGGPGGRKRSRTRSSRASRPRRTASGNHRPEAAWNAKSGRNGARVSAPLPRALTPSEADAPTSTATAAPAADTAPAALAAARAAASRLAGFEDRLDAAIAGLEGMLHDVTSRARKAGVESSLRLAFARVLPTARAGLAAALDVVRLLEPPERLDRFGMDPRFDRRIEPVLELLCSSWWRVDVRGAARVPAIGPAIVVANHAGVVPWDALVLRHALRREHPAHRELRPLLDDRECSLPVFGPAAIRAGAVRASAEAAQALLANGEVIGVFPEGSAGSRKPWRERYRLLRFGRGGFAKVALRTGAPLVPCAIVGSEEASHGLSRPGWLAERLGVPMLAANPSLRLGAAGVLPLPSRWSIHFGEPMAVGDHGPEAVDDPQVVNGIAEGVRARVQAMLEELLAARSSVYL